MIRRSYVWLPAALLCACLAHRCVNHWQSESRAGNRTHHKVISYATDASKRAGDLQSVIDSVDAHASTTANLAALQRLRQMLIQLPPAEALEWIRNFLTSSADRATGMDLAIGPQGALTAWPSLRVCLLDLLTEIDGRQASELSREILKSPTTADEWAIALRNVGRFESTSESMNYLRERSEVLIRNPAWRADPSVGYLNAFDVLVHANATESLPLLSNLIQGKDRKDLAHAAFLTLDRLVQKSPADALARIAADHELQQNRPEMTAQEFARADLRDPAQLELVKSWLLDPSRKEPELRAFAATYPNNNHFVSNNLLSSEKTVAGNDLAAHDVAVLEIVSSWDQDPRFRPIKEHLKTMITRLENFVNSPTATPANPEPHR